MEAMCPQCSMHYEVPEELLQQSPQVACPGCQVALVFVQPGTDIPLEPQPNATGGQPTVPVATAEEAVFPPPAAEPVGGWAAGDLLWSGMSPQAAWTPPEPAPSPAVEAVPSEQLQISPPAPETVAAAFPLATPGETAWPTEATETVDPGESADPLTAPVVVSESPAPPASEPATFPETPTATEAARSEQTPSFETPLWQPLEAQPPTVSVTTPSEPPPARPPAATPGADAQAQDDWATAAARWAASGFAPDAAPQFMKRPSTPVATPAAPPAGESPPAVESSPVPQTAVPQPQFNLPPAASPPVPTSASVMTPPPPKAATPPPLAHPPPAASPPPVPSNSRRAATGYIMRGSGEGVKENSPWSSAPADTVPPKADSLLPKGELPGLATLKVPVSPPIIATGPRSKPAPVDVPRPPKSRAGLILLFVILALAAAAAALWYWKGPPSTWLELVRSWLPRPQEKLVEVPSSPPSPVARPEEQPPAEITKPAPAEPEPKADPTPPTAPDGKPTVEKRPAGAEKPALKPQGATAAKPAIKPADAAAQALKLYQDGNRLVKEKKYAEAVASYKKSLATDPKFTLAHRGLGIVFALLGRNEDACKEYQAYYKALPGDSKEKPQLEVILKGCR